MNVVYVILVYDISLEKKGARTLSHVFKICKKYLRHIQNSVFEGELSDSQENALKSELKKQIRNDIDSIIIFKSRQEKWLDKEFWGKSDENMSNFI